MSASRRPYRTIEQLENEIARVLGTIAALDVLIARLRTSRDQATTVNEVRAAERELREARDAHRRTKETLRTLQQWRQWDGM